MYNCLISKLYTLTYLFFKMPKQNKLIIKGAIIFISLELLAFAFKDSGGISGRFGRGPFSIRKAIAENGSRTSLAETPGFGVTINGGDAETASPQTIVNLYGGSDTTTVEISEDPAFAEKQQFHYDADFKKNNTPYQFSGVPGLKTIYAKFCVASGVCSAEYSDSIIFDPSTKTLSVYDTNRDGRVDLYEFNQLVANWGPQDAINPCDYDGSGAVVAQSRGPG